ncbi:MAG: DUF1566 domain-containing protein [Calditrichia bacterium]
MRQLYAPAVMLGALLLLSSCYYGPSKAKRSSSDVRVRSEASSRLPEDSTEVLLREDGVFDSRKNPEADGYANEFELQLGGKVVYDWQSGLLWQRSGSAYYMAYSQTRSYVDSLNRVGYAGFSDWRMPTLSEAMTLVEPARRSNQLHIDPLFSSKQYAVWTSDKKSNLWAWVVYFSDGYSHYDQVEYGGSFVRAVRTAR